MVMSIRFAVFLFLCIRIIHADTMFLYILFSYSRYFVDCSRVSQRTAHTEGGLYLTIQSCCTMGKFVGAHYVSWSCYGEVWQSVQYEDNHFFRTSV